MRLSTSLGIIELEGMVVEEEEEEEEEGRRRPT